MNAKQSGRHLLLDRRDAAWLILPAGLVLLLFLPLILHPDRVLLSADMIRIFSVLQYLEHSSLTQFGEIPFFNPALLSGNPHLANLQAQHFYPFAFPGRLCLCDWMLGLQIPFHIFLFALGGYILSRTLMVSRAGAAMAAVILAGSMRMGAEVFAGHLTLITCVAWLPWQTACVQLILERRKWICVPILAVFFALPVLSGHVQPLAYQGIVLLIYALLLGHRLSRQGQASGMEIVLVGFSAVMALALAAVQLVPFLEFQEFFIRSAPFGKSLEGYHLALRDLWQLLLPGIGINPLPGASDGQNHFFWEKTLTLGAAPLLLLLAALLHIRNRPVILFGTACLAGAVFSGLDWPLSQNDLPLFSSFRNPARAWLVALPFGAVIAGIGLDFLLTPARQLNRGIARLKYPSVMALGLAAMIAGHLYVRSTGLFPAPSVLPLLAAAVVFVAGSVRPLSTRGARLRLVAIILAVSVEVIVLFRPMVHTVPAAQVFPRTPVMEYLASQPKPFRILDGASAVPQQAAIRMGLQSIGADSEPILTTTYIELLNLAWTGNPTSDSSILLRKDLENAVRPELFHLMNLRYFLADKPVNASWLKVTGRMTTPRGDVYLHENTDVLPRAFVVGRAFAEPDRWKRLEHLKQIDLKRQAIIEKSISPPLDEISSRPAFYERFSPNRFAAAATIKQPGLLVVSEQYYPHWRAFLDGEELKVLRVNHAFLGVVLSPGTHVVRFEAKSRQFQMAKMATTGAGILVLFVLLVGWRNIIFTRRAKRKKENF